MTINFEKISDAALRTIDEMRATDADPNRTDNNSAQPAESRINAFYRIIGLPALISDPKKTTVIRKRNNGNLFDSFSSEDPAIKDLLNETTQRERRFSTLLNESDIVNFLDESKFDISDSIKKDIGRKGNLFPTIVNGDILIYPQDRRVGGAFFKKDSDLKVNGIAYRRPLIELIVLLRLREFGLSNTASDQNIKNSFVELQESGFFEGQSENLLTLEIITELTNAVAGEDGIKKIVSSTVEKLGKVRTKIRESFGNSIGESVPSEIQKVFKTDGRGELEIKKLERENALLEIDSRAVLLEYDDSIGKEATKNMKDALLAPVVLDLIASDKDKIEKDLSDINTKIQSTNQFQKKMHKNMDLFLGTFSGLSGIDILVVLTALFNISIGDLLGLLNQDAINRLKELRGSDLPSRNQNVLDAVTKLEAKIDQIYTRINIIIKETDEG